MKKQVEYYTVGWFGKDDVEPTRVSETDFVACVDDGGVISYVMTWNSDLQDTVAVLTATVPHGKKIEIETRDDVHEDCETCGTSWAEAGSVKIDGKTVLDIEPQAHCYDGVSHSEAELLVMALKKVGIDVLVDGHPFHVTRHDEDYHGPLE